MFYEQKLLYKDARTFLYIIAALLIIGSLFIYSSSSVYALEKFGASHFFFKKHLMGLACGLLAMLISIIMPLRIIKITSPFLLLASLALATLTLVPSFGINIHGSSRWISIKGFGFQPSELLKISLILYLAYVFSKNEQKRCLPLLLCIIGIMAFILLKQPDFGMTVTLATTAFMLFFIVHFKLSYLIATCLVALPTIIALIYMQPYRFKRIMTFLNPWQDPHGAGFQIIQSLIAIGSGGWFGIGVSHSKQKFFYLPMQHTDFIFSIIAEETGFIGSMLLLSLYTFFLYFGMRIAWQLKDKFSIFATLGFITLITLQTIINLCVVTGLLPTKGIGLPFISYGNTALVCNMIMIGLILNFIRENR